jgi:hypothetical protein
MIRIKKNVRANWLLTENYEEKIFLIIYFYIFFFKIMNRHDNLNVLLKEIKLWKNIDGQKP